MSVDPLIDFIKKVAVEVFNSSVAVQSEAPKYRRYPYSLARPGHNEAISQILKNDRTILSSPTGTGKTAVYLTAAAESGLKTIVITPRNGLQESVASYGQKINIPMPVLFARHKHCKYGSDLPCSAKFKVGNAWYFEYRGKMYEYPCNDCPYEMLKHSIRDLFRYGECIPVLNQGNFWFLRPIAEFVVIDEADETVRSITESVSYRGEAGTDDPVEVLEWMRTAVQDDITKILEALEVERRKDRLKELNNRLEALERKLRKINLFMSYPADKLITYVRGGGNGGGSGSGKSKSITYVEVHDSPLNVAERLFGRAEKICFVSATSMPTDQAESGMPHYTNIYFNIPFKARVIYAPIGNFSVRNISNGHTELFDLAADVIVKTYEFITNLTGMTKAPIHCGNLSMHGDGIYKAICARGGKVVLMEEGRQRDAIKEFLSGGSDFLCAVAVEYGYDWGFSPVQYILKVPFADLGDPRLGAIKKLLGPKFNDWYNWDALSRVIQASGRNARGPDDFGLTVILDSTFGRLYERYYHLIPEWFKDRVVIYKADGGAV